MSIGGGNTVIRIDSVANNAGFTSSASALVAHNRLIEALNRSQESRMDRIYRAHRRLERIVATSIGAFGKFTTLLSKGFAISLAATSAALLGIKGALVAGRLAARGFNVVMQGLATAAAAAAVALSTLAAAQREYAAASSSYAYQATQFKSSLMVSASALRLFTSNQQLAISGQESLTQAFSAISKVTPVTGELVKATEALGDFVATTGDMKNIASAGEFLASLVKSGQLTEDLAKGADKLGPRFADAMKQLRERGVTSAQAVIEELTSGAAAASVGVQGMLNTVNNTLFGTFKRNFQILRNDFADLGEFFLEPATTSTQRIFATLRSGVYRASSSIIGFGNATFFGGLETAVAKLTDFFVNFLVKYLPKLEGMGGKISEVFTQIKRGYGAFADALKSLEPAGDVLWNFVKAVASPVFTSFGRGLGDFQDTLLANEDSLMSFGNAIGDFFVAVGQLFGEMKRVLMDVLPVLEKIVDAMAGIVRALTAVVGGLGGLFGGQAGGVAALGGMFLGSQLFGALGQRVGRRTANMVYGDVRDVGGRQRRGRGGMPFLGGGGVAGQGQGLRSERSGLARNATVRRLLGPPRRQAMQPLRALPTSSPLPSFGLPEGQRQAMIAAHQRHIAAINQQNYAIRQSNRQIQANNRLARNQYMRSARGRAYRGVSRLRRGQTGAAMAAAPLLASMALGQIAPEGEVSNNAQNALSTLAMAGMVGNMFGRAGATMGVAAPFILGQFGESVGAKGAGMTGTGLSAIAALRAFGVIGTPAALIGGGAVAAAGGGMMAGGAIERATGSRALGGLGAAATGALAGAAFGSIVPGVGTAVGAVAGAATGAIIGAVSYAFTKSEAARQAEEAATQFAQRIATRVTGFVQQGKFGSARGELGDLRSNALLARLYLSGMGDFEARTQLLNMRQYRNVRAQRGGKSPNAAYYALRQEEQDALASNDPLIQRARESGDPEAFLKKYLERTKTTRQELAGTMETVNRNTTILSRITGKSRTEIERLARTVGFDLTQKITDFKKAVEEIADLKIWGTLKELTQIKTDKFGKIVTSITEPIIQAEETRLAVDQAFANLASLGGGTAAEQAEAFRLATQYEMFITGGDVDQALENLRNLFGDGGTMFQIVDGVPQALSGLEDKMGTIKNLVRDAFDKYYREILDTNLASLRAEITTGKFKNKLPLAAATAIERTFGILTPEQKKDFMTGLEDAIAAGPDQTVRLFGYDRTGIEEDMARGMGMETALSPLEQWARGWGIDLQNAGTVATQNIDIAANNLAEGGQQIIEAIQAINTSIADYAPVAGPLVMLAMLEMLKGGDTATPRSDTATPRSGRFGDTAGSRFSRTLQSHRALNGRFPGRRQITSGIRGFGLGSLSSDHTTGMAYDLTGDNLGAYALAARSAGGFAEFHGSAGNRHLHVVPGHYGDTANPVGMGSSSVSTDSSQNVFNININPSQNASAEQIAEQVMVRIERAQRSSRERS